MPDFNTNVNAPSGGSYTRALTDFSALGNLPQDYYKGQQALRTEEQQTIFRNGIPKIAGTDQPDFNAMASKMLQFGDYANASNYYKLGGLQGPSVYGGTGAGEGPAGGPSSTVGSPNPSSGYNTTNGAGPDSGGGNVPDSRVAGPGSNTIQGIALKMGLPQDAATTQAIDSVTRQLGISPDTPFDDPQQQRRAIDLLRSYGSNRQATQGGGSRVAQGGASQPPGAGGSMAPQPASPGPQTGLEQGQSVRHPMQQITQQAEAAVQSMLPPQFRNGQNGGAAGFINAAAAQAERLARFGGAEGAASAKLIGQHVEKVLGALQSYNAPTEKQKDLISGATARELEVKNEVGQSQKTYNGMQAASTQYERDLKPYLDISRSVLNDPSMYTGTGANLALNINRVRAVFGDQKAAMLQEALQKVTASSVLGQINTQKDQMQEAGGTAGRIFAQQVDLVEKAAPALSNTLGGNRFLIEVSTRMGELSTRVSQMARDYIRRYGHLDVGFDQQVSDYMTKHPVFNAKEMAHPELLGAPTVPPGLRDQAQVLAWARSMGLKPGDPLRAPDGSYKTVPK